MTVTKFDVQARSLGDLLSSGSPQFTVPHYQRPFAWTNEQVDELWSDLLAAIDEKDEDYFMGAVVLIHQGKGGKFSIIDGQQRIATLTVVLAALRDRLEDLGELETASELHRLIIRKTLQKETVPIVVLRDRENSRYFAEHIQRRIHDRPAPPKGKPGRPRKIYIKQAYETSRERVGDEIVELSDKKKIQRLIRIAEFVKDGVVLITTIVGSDTDAYVVFETLNHRGLDLTIADLVKNHLFSLGSKSDHLEEMRSLWEQTTSNLEGEGVSVPRFLRHFWLSKHARVTERKLFVRIKDHLRPLKADGHLRFASDLATEASLYRRLVEPSATDPHATDIVDFRDMGIMQHLPLLLAARVAGLPAMQFSRLVALCGTVTMRYLISGDRNPNQLERSYSTWAIRLRKGGEGVVDEIVNEANSLCPDDDEFMAGFKALANLKTAQTRYVLRKVNEHLSGKEMRLAGPAYVHLEHILPLNPSPGWTPYIPSDRQKARALAQRLGNLTLLDEMLNKEASNRPFDQKKANYYSKSKIEITKQLCTEDTWDAKRIDARQEKMASFAPAIWSL